MKERLLGLIERIDKIEELFHTSAGVYRGLKFINDVQEFTIWLQAVRAELREIHSRTHDTFIFEAIHDLDGFNGWRDKLQFDKVKGNLLAIKDNIDEYYPKEKTSISRTNTEENKAMRKTPKIFISHSSKDVEYATQLVTLFDNMGISDNQIFCSSVPGYDIPLDKDIFEYLREQFERYDLHVIFVLSSSYYSSKVSLNEMGAAWVLRKNNTSILLPGFDFAQIEGVIGKDRISIKLDKGEDELKDKLNQLYANMVEEFGLTKKRDVIWIWRICFSSFRRLTSP